MPRSPLALAALASVAVEGLDVYDVLRSRHTSTDFDVVVVKDATGNRWVVKAPKRAAAGAAQQAELAILKALGPLHDAGTIDFDVPRPVGATDVGKPDGGQAVVYTEVAGSRLGLATLTPGPGLAASLGRCLAQVHTLPPAVIEDAGLPSYSADEYRQRRLAELDAAAGTGKVPPVLSDRWEQQLENVAWWKFLPTVVHGALSEESVVVSEGRVAGLTDWMDAQCADPADDFAWLLAAAPDDAVESVLEAYAATRQEFADRHLLDRARLASELAVVRWLMYGVRADNQDVVADAVEMLEDLAQAVSEES